ncbi:NAD(P)H-hydrate dehydratase [Candidatus Wirthbacteria bacterium CG2_30_54_11]|uniref:ADP-dependent (S)-NAD(P)H-hydrate dehydratase n=1 Tax=Candidatus Wirthbacteria bacterium CG2_30_54_11 TaxID=1817892 RepID=A0A1J5IKG1_9BACT|nr:MAG: NAD(P)H-hydrate dehydratase [Candidatus Wirthbacteria bacterium CG2_30_54_11]
MSDLIGVQEVKELSDPKPGSHKGENGKLLIIVGSERYHGAVLYATKVASKFVDLIYFCSVPENNDLLRSLKSRSCEFIAIPRSEAYLTAASVDVILIGPGLGRGKEEQQLVEQLMKDHRNKKFVLDADALHLIKPKWLHERCIVTPHREEFKALFDMEPSESEVLNAAKKYHCVIVSKGETDLVSNGFELKSNSTGNAGMTKGGTGDVLAGLTAALACTNDPYLAAKAAVFLNGLAGDRLQKRVLYYYNASDLISEIPKAAAYIKKS